MPFVKGKSGNPGGKPKGLAAVRDYIAGQTKDGRALVDFHLAIMSGKPVVVPHAEGEEPFSLLPVVKEMQASADWLADRLWGKAPQSLDLGGPGGEPLSIQIIRTVAK